MKTVAIGRFKATCLNLLENVRRNHEPLLITKHRTPIAKVVAVDEDTLKSDWQSLKGTVLQEDDIVSPLGAEEWSACG